MRFETLFNNLQFVKDHNTRKNSDNKSQSIILKGSVNG